MPFRGRYFLGDEIPLGVLTRNASGVPVAPDACPSLEIYGPAGKVPGGWLPGGLAGGGSLVPVLDRYGSTGLFQVRVLLSSLFALGRYTASYRWTVGGFQGLDVDSWEVLPGGDGKGAALSMAYLRQPQADYLVRQTNSGRLVANRNPRL